MTTKEDEDLNQRKASKRSPRMKTGMKAPDGMGMVVATADIQNCRRDDMKHFLVKNSELMIATNRNQMRLNFLTVQPLIGVSTSTCGEILACEPRLSHVRVLCFHTGNSNICLQHYTGFMK